MCSYGKVHRCYEQCFIFKARANALSFVLSTVKCQSIFHPSVTANVFQVFTQNVLNKFVLITKRFIMSKRSKNNKVGVDLVATCRWSFPLRPWEDRGAIKEDGETNLWLWECERKDNEPKDWLFSCGWRWRQRASLSSFMARRVLSHSGLLIYSL